MLRVISTEIFYPSFDLFLSLSFLDFLDDFRLGFESLSIAAVDVVVGVFSIGFFLGIEDFFVHWRIFVMIKGPSTSANTTFAINEIRNASQYSERSDLHYSLSDSKF